MLHVPLPPSDGEQDHLEPSDTSPSCRFDENMFQGVHAGSGEVRAESVSKSERKEENRGNEIIAAKKSGVL